MQVGGGVVSVPVLTRLVATRAYAATLALQRRQLEGAAGAIYRIS